MLLKVTVLGLKMSRIRRNLQLDRVSKCTDHMKKKQEVLSDIRKVHTSNLGAEKAMAPHSSTLAWKIPWTEEPGGLQSMGSRRVGHD